MSLMCGKLTKQIQCMQNYQPRMDSGVNTVTNSRHENSVTNRSSSLNADICLRVRSKYDR